MPQLWEDLITLRSFDDAWEKVRSNGGGAGGDNKSLTAFQSGAHRHIAKIHIKMSLTGHMHTSLIVLLKFRRKTAQSGYCGYLPSRIVLFIPLSL